MEQSKIITFFKKRRKDDTVLSVFCLTFAFLKRTIMRKTNFTVLLLLSAATVLFVACHKAEDDRFDHKYKISKTWMYNTKSEPTTYHYKDGKLTKVRFPYGSYLHFVYEKKFQVKRINFEGLDGIIDEWADITYRDDKIAEIKVYLEGTLIANQKFTIENKKIAKIYSYILPHYYDLKAETKNMLYDVESLELLAVQNKTKGELSLKSEHHITYTGDNITTTIAYNKLAGDTVTTRYAYDENINPYYGLNFNFMGLDGYSRNNPVSKTISHSTGILSYTYSYVYNKHDYPTIISKKEANEEVGENTFIEYVK
jgi:hypothetical protein